MEEQIKFASISSLAVRWGVSEDKASKIAEKYRGRAGFFDMGFKRRGATRGYAILRIHPELLKIIEREGRD
jgi:hypothetical protein